MGFSLKKLISKPLDIIKKPFDDLQKIDKAVRGVVGGVIGQVGQRLSQSDAVQREIGRDAFEGMRPRFEMGQRRRPEGERTRDDLRGTREGRVLERTLARFFQKLEQLLDRLGGGAPDRRVPDRIRLSPVETGRDPRFPDRIRLSPIETGGHRVDDPSFRL